MLAGTRDGPRTSLAAPAPVGPLRRARTPLPGALWLLLRGAGARRPRRWGRSRSPCPRRRGSRTIRARRACCSRRWRRRPWPAACSPAAVSGAVPPQWRIVGLAGGDGGGARAHGHGGEPPRTARRRADRSRCARSARCSRAPMCSPTGWRPRDRARAPSRGWSPPTTGDWRSAPRRQERWSKARTPAAGLWFGCGVCAGGGRPGDCRGADVRTRTQTGACIPESVEYLATLRFTKRQGIAT